MKKLDFISRITGKVQKVRLVRSGCQFKESRAKKSGALHIYDAEIDVHHNVFDSCTSRAGGASIDTLNCPMNEAVVMLVSTKGTTESMIGKFKLCEPKNLLLK